MIANNEKDNLNKKFGLYEFLVYTIVTIMFTCAAVLILPFVKVYTSGISDIDYIRPTFAYILVFAFAMLAIRGPYNILTLAAGHYRQTRNGAFAEAAINVIVSVVGVYFWGIAGVALGTLCALFFRTVQFAWYLSKNILDRKFMVFVKRMVIALISAATSVLAVNLLPDFTVDSYLNWTFYAVLSGLIIVTVTFIINLIFSKKELFETVNYIRSVLIKRRKK